LKRSEMATFFAHLPSSLIGMEACSSAHHWARKLTAFGHEVRLIAPQFVKPYVKTNKNDRNDAEATCEAVVRPNMRFVPVKTSEQQTVLALYRARAAYVKARTAQANQRRGLLSEFGIILPQGIGRLYRQVPDILADGDNAVLSKNWNEAVTLLCDSRSSTFRQGEHDSRSGRYRREPASAGAAIDFPDLDDYALGGSAQHIRERRGVAMPAQRK